MVHIDSFHFGTIVVNGVSYSSDIKIIGEKVVSRWWRRSGHLVVLEDIQDIVAAGPDAVVIGQGSPGLMKISDPVRNLLKKNGASLQAAETAKAVEIFNALVMKNKNVAAGFHVGC
jgi:hypothetical protein